MIEKIQGIMSKEEFNEVIEEKIKSASETFTLAIIDIDDFETVNSYYGETVGDKVIQKIASVLKQNLRTNDLVGRYNKDEFHVLFSSTNAETGFIMVEEIRRYFHENTFQLGDKKRDILIKISAGVGNFPRDAKNAVELYRAAGSALFRAKREGKNRVCLAESENMLLKSNYYTKTQLERLGELSKKTDKTEAFLLREALDDLFDKYSK
ncbi:diguanylate cyclase (GGDEF) domain-containing protein [Natronincola peptidivorans]|uniref:Diguanylate cyclase (GGDEF) domain-containing protein n=1 Tax=Natronincola peptidivorans TaxID=426128 RepID=A0A1I0GEB5_9FIRM|nr:GGDEF domain-containing protein [Natronincola peptidivorans]SET69151.1 diguanylate cyclase (GGDEF) domain-containing protein [Natronincola peptidivorans]